MICFLCKLEKRYINDFLIFIKFLIFFVGIIKIHHVINKKIQKIKDPGKIGKIIGIKDHKINKTAKNNLIKKGIIVFILV